MESKLKIYKHFNRYTISDIGTVFDFKLNRVINHQITKDGYPVITLRDDNGKRKTMKIHRLVAELFVENVNNKSEVNHKDGNKLNNSIDNLEWMSHSENIKHAWDNGLIVNTEQRKKKIRNQRKRIGIDNHKSRKIRCITTGEIFNSLTEACKKYNMRNGNLSRVCSGHAKTLKNMKWEYYNGD